jgi:hypothetical protein
MPTLTNARPGRSLRKASSILGSSLFAKVLSGS